MFQRILVPLDGSLLAEKALDGVGEIAQKFNSEIILLRVAEEMRPMMIADSNMHGGYAYLDLLRSVHEREIEDARTYLVDIKRRLTGEGLTVSTQLQTKLSPAEAILTTANAHEVDVIAMSTHGRGGVTRWVYGSVADKVLRSCDIPILLIRVAPEADTFRLPAIESEEDISSHDVVLQID